MKSLISIIIPVYNHAHTLKLTFDCINRQTYRNIEVILVNDGSTDNFTEVEKAIKCDFPLQVIEQANQGAPRARNVGFKQARGELVIFWDADTIATPDMLTTLVGALKDNPNAAYAYSQFKFGWKKFKCQEFEPKDLRRYNYIDTTSLIRKSALLGIVNVPFDESLSRFQDWDLWLTLLEKGFTGVFVPKVLYKKIAKRDGLSLGGWSGTYFSLLMPWKAKRRVLYEEGRGVVLKKHWLL